MMGEAAWFLYKGAQALVCEGHVSRTLNPKGQRQQKIMSFCDSRTYVYWIYWIEYFPLKL